jgi:hypothetical protein
MAKPTTSDGWDFYNFHIHENITGGSFVSAESTLVAAGPPTLGTSSASVLPIGLLETAGLQQSRQLQRIFEIGSIRSYFIPGRCIGSLSVGRTFYHGPSLLRILYGYWAGKDPDATAIKSLLDSAKVPASASENYGSKITLKSNPGYGDLFINLASDLFAQPTGMAIYYKDSNTETYGGLYLEYCYIQGHQMTISSGSVLIMEGVSIQYDMLKPLNIGSNLVEA